MPRFARANDARRIQEALLRLAQSWIGNLNMRLNRRSCQDFQTLAPGVVQVPINCNSTGAVGYSDEMSVGGLRTEGNYFTVDEVSANALAAN